MMTAQVKRTHAKDKHVDLVDRYKEIGISAVAAAVQCKRSLTQSQPKKPRSKGNRTESRRGAHAKASAGRARHLAAR
jgi:hypothetical protein